MHIDRIMNALAAYNTPAKPAKPKPAPPVVAAPKPNGHTVLNSDELLAITVGRIVAALNLEAQGVTSEVMIQRVKDYEKPFEGLVQ
jgi:hypothetical protein